MRTVMRALIRAARVARRGTQLVMEAVITPLLEKNPRKTVLLTANDFRMVISMSRVVVLCFAVVMLAQVRYAGVAGWPEATLCITVVLALPLLSALEKLPPDATLDTFTALLGRVGRGGVRSIASVYGTGPSRYDDHRLDEANDHWVNGGMTAAVRATVRPPVRATGRTP